jgi:hypothetical protein
MTSAIDERNARMAPEVPATDGASLSLAPYGNLSGFRTGRRNARLLEVPF